jgi:SAM-dependent methyltransferase
MPFGDNILTKDQNKRRYYFSRLFGWPPHIGNRVRARNVNRVLRARPGDRILEVGSSYGVFSFDLARRGATVVGFDIDLEPISFARGQLSKKNLNYPLHFFTAMAEHMPLKDNQFDKIVTVDVMEHVTDDEAAAREMFRVLKPGGSLVMHVPLDVRLHISPIRLPRARAQKTDIGHMHERDGYIREDVEKLLTNAGFEIESVIITNRFFTAIAWEIENQFTFGRYLFPILYPLTFMDIFAPARGNGFLIQAKKAV